MELSLPLQKQFNFYKNKLLLSFACCDLCGSSCQHYALLCQACSYDLPRFKLDIVHADLLNWPIINQGLPDIKFDHLLCLSPYITPFKQWLSQYKYSGRFELGAFFAHMLADHLKKYWLQSSSTYLPQQPDLILSVPLHYKKWQIRGYNQAHLLAENLAKQIQLPYCSTGIIRCKPTLSQVGQSGVNRRKSLHNAFEIKLNTTDIPRHVLLIDDVVTTGATTNEITKKLKQIGVNKVTVVALCLSLPNAKVLLER